MVWHSHMLNPRDYLEDCLRFGRGAIWAAGLPWDLVNEAIDNSFNYRVPDSCAAAWKSRTCREWDNVEDSVAKTISCPACSTRYAIPWTSCGLPEDSKAPPPGLVGKGYGDGEFGLVCHNCQVTINKDLLVVARFTSDMQALLVQDRPMPGTLLDHKAGLPYTHECSSVSMEDLTYPNRLLKYHIRNELLELIKPNSSVPVTMETVRGKIEYILLIDKDKLSEGGVAELKLTPGGRVAIRKVMSHYWGNSSVFSLELGGAVMRQGVFTEKMQKVYESDATFHGAI